MRIAATMLAVLMAFGFLAAPAHAGRSAELVDPPPVPVPAGLTAEQVAKEIKRALLGRGWEVSEQSEGQILSTLHLREHMARIRISYDTRQVAIEYVDSSQLDYKLKKGKPHIHSNYLGWIGYLTRDIGTNLQLALE